MDDKDWQDFWNAFDAETDKAEEWFQEENIKAHGNGHYFMSSDELWEVQQKIIRKLVDAKLREKSTC
jgi:hypothetical protein